MCTIIFGVAVFLACIFGGDMYFNWQERKEKENESLSNKP